MSFLDKILDSDVDEKAVSDMQQSLQSEIFSSQQQQQVSLEEGVWGLQSSSGFEGRALAGLGAGC